MPGYLTQKVPPKPQQTSASVISRSDTPSTEARSLRGSVLDAEFAQARAGVVIGGACRELRLDPLDLHHAGEEGHELMRAAGQIDSGRVVGGARRRRVPDSA